jgi:hypothetical protein
MIFNKKTLTGLTSSLLLFSLLMLSIPANISANTLSKTRTLFPLQEHSFEKVLQKANAKNDATAFISEITNDKFAIQVWKNGQMIGTSSVQTSGTNLTYKFTVGASFYLLLRVDNQPFQISSSNAVVATIQTDKNKVELTNSQFLGRAKFSKKQISILNQISSEVNLQKQFIDVVKSTARLKEAEYVQNLLGGVACTGAITDCIVAAIEYLGSIGALITLCPESLGISCVAALLVHPVLALHVGTECGKVKGACAEVPQGGNEY